MKPLVFLILFSAAMGSAVAGSQPFEKDLVKTSAGDLEITFIGHGTLMFIFQKKVVHVDPWGKLADYPALPKADLILVTHSHGDHLDPDAIAAVSTEKTVRVFARDCIQTLKEGIPMGNGDVKTVCGLTIEAIPAYNLAHKRDSGEPFHPKGNGNGYLITFGNKRIYVAGDTENTPEMKALKDIAVAFLPMNLPYTMTPEMVADAAKAFRPNILYPYHFSDTDPNRLVELMKDAREIEVRIRRMK